MKEYLYDPHTHTAETSKCGHLPAAEVVDRVLGTDFPPGGDGSSPPGVLVPD